MGFQQGLSGLYAASKNLDVIGHNIANSGTVGFKASRTEFDEMVASAIGTTSGTNTGIGVSVGAISQQFTQGGITVTGNNLDLAINGNGFFQVRQPDGSFAYTRAGNFKLDKEGNVITNNNARLMGYPFDKTTGKALTGQLMPMTFPTGAPIAAEQTKNAKLTFNLEATAKPAATTTPPTPRSTYGTSITVYDSQGVAVPMNFYFVKKDANTWEMYDGLDDPNVTPPVQAKMIGTLVFDKDGKLQSIAAGTGAQANGKSLILDVNSSPANPNAGPTAPQAPDTFPVTIDFSGATQFGTKFAVTESTQDGYTAGQLTAINVGDDGTIMASYSNGVTRAEGVVALATFRNTQGLADVGNNLWVETGASGQPTLGQPTSGAFGALRSGALEESNVDLTAELVNMMTAQRAYQANAQTIKTQDQVMSTLVNLR